MLAGSSRRSSWTSPPCQFFCPMWDKRGTSWEAITGHIAREAQMGDVASQLLARKHFWVVLVVGLIVLCPVYRTTRG
jgi:hypothetical protein